MKYMNNCYGSSRIFDKARCKIPMDLQFFAETDGNGGGTGNDTGDAGGAAGSENNKEAGADTRGDQSTQSFDDILKDPAYQAEFDRRIAKALKTQESKLTADINSKIENARTEAEKLAKMNTDQKEQYEKEKKEQELADREARLTERELKATAKETLVSKGLPASLADVLNYTDAEACNKSIEAVEAAFREAVAAGVEEKLRGGTPPKKAPDSSQMFTKEQIEAMSPDEINKNWEAVQASLKKMN